MWPEAGNVKEDFPNQSMLACISERVAAIKRRGEGGGIHVVIVIVRVEGVDLQIG